MGKKCKTAPTFSLYIFILENIDTEFYKNININGTRFIVLRNYCFFNAFSFQHSIDKCNLLEEKFFWVLKLKYLRTCDLDRAEWHSQGRRTCGERALHPGPEEDCEPRSRASRGTWVKQAGRESSESSQRALSSHRGCEMRTCDPENSTGCQDPQG